MVSDIRFGRLAPVAAVIAMFAAGLQGCASFGETEQLTGTGAPAVDAERSGEPTPETPTSASPASLPTSIDFGDVDCNTVVAARSVTLPGVQTGSTPWAAGVEGDIFSAFPTAGMLAQGASELITVKPVKTTTTELTLSPIERKLTVDINAVSQIVLLRMQPRGGIVKFATEDLDLGQVFWGGLAQQTTKVTNTGNAAITVVITSSNSKISISPKTLDLAPQGSIDVTIALTSSGKHSGTAIVVAKSGTLCLATPLKFSGELGGDY